MTALLKRKIEFDGFGIALRQWLSGEVTGHLGTYMYTEDSDDHRWKNGHSATTYYLGRDDKATFDLALKDLGIEVTNFFDLGPGGEAAVRAKTIPLVAAIKAKNYYPIDLSTTLAQGACELVKETLQVSGEPVVADFFEPLPVNKPDALLAFMGGTLGNIETHNSAASLQNRLTQIFSHFRKAASGNSRFLVSFDANTNVKEILSCYQNEEFGGLIRSCIDRALDTGDFEYDVTWRADNYQLATGLRSTQDQIIDLGDEQFSVEQGEFLPVLNSYRFPAQFVKEAAEKAGWKYQKEWSATGRVHYLLFS